jgi:hypothetical protein
MCTLTPCLAAGGGQLPPSPATALPHQHRHLPPCLVSPPCKCFADNDLVPLYSVASSVLLDNIAAQCCDISLKSNSTSPFSSLEALVGESLHRQTKRQKKSTFIYCTIFKKHKSGRDFQRGQIWNDCSQKPNTNYGSHPLHRKPKVLFFCFFTLPYLILLLSPSFFPSFFLFIKRDFWQ